MYNSMNIAGYKLLTRKHNWGGGGSSVKFCTECTLNIVTSFDLSVYTKKYRVYFCCCPTYFVTHT